VVIVTSDHGDEFMDHGGFGHGMHLETEMLHIPLILTGCGMVPRREAALVRQLDLAPTIVDLAGLPTPSDFAGTSLLPAVREQPATKPEITSSFAWVGAHRSLTTPQWHLTLDLQNRAIQLYDLHQDPGGFENLVDDRPNVVAILTDQLNRLEKQRLKAVREASEMATREDPPGDDVVDPEVREQLRALGYSD
jgi:arylsulfatase A-like enzyme